MRTPVIHSPGTECEIGCDPALGCAPDLGEGHRTRRLRSQDLNLRVERAEHGGDAGRVGRGAGLVVVDAGELLDRAVLQDGAGLRAALQTRERSVAVVAAARVLAQVAPERRAPPNLGTRRQPGRLRQRRDEALQRIVRGDLVQRHARTQQDRAILLDRDRLEAGHVDQAHDPLGFVHALLQTIHQVDAAGLEGGVPEVASDLVPGTRSQEREGLHGVTPSSEAPRARGPGSWEAPGLGRPVRRTRHSPRRPPWARWPARPTPSCRRCSNPR